MASITVRTLVTDELLESWNLSRLAFGGPPDPSPRALADAPGVLRYGAFDESGRLVGKAIDLFQEHWWCGQAVPSAGVAGVAVLPEARGRGIARALMTALLAGARDRGAAISTLYPTVAAPYRSFGWEFCGSLRTVDLVTAFVPPYRPSTALSVRPGGPADLPSVRRLYDTVAKERTGLLTRLSRSGGTYWPDPDDRLPDGVDGITLVHDGDDLVGYAAWERGQGYDADAVLTVSEVHALSGAAARELVGVLGSWRSVAPTLRLKPLAGDAVTPYLPLEVAREHHQQPWMHRPVDVVAAIAGRRWPAYVSGTVEFGLVDPEAPWNTGAWRLSITDGVGALTPTSAEPALSLTPRGFALLYCGAATATAVAAAGLLSTAPGADPSLLDVLAAGPRAELLDYF